MPIYGLPLMRLSLKYGARYVRQLAVQPVINDLYSRRATFAQPVAQVSVLSKPEVSEPGAEAGRMLFGAAPEAGFSLKWNDFHPSTDFDWARGFHPKRLELCLNLCGSGRIWDTTETLELTDRTCGFYLPGKRGL